MTLPSVSNIRQALAVSLRRFPLVILAGLFGTVAMIVLNHSESESAKEIAARVGFAMGFAFPLLVAPPLGRRSGFGKIGFGPKGGRRAFYSVPEGFGAGRLRMVMRLSRASSDGLQVCRAGSSLKRLWTMRRS